jgi:uncharacterized glyoxalase superfamily protein PhnB
MADPVPRFQQDKLVVRDMDAVIDAGEEPTVEFDNEAGAKLWHAAWRESGDGPRTVIGFSVPSRDAVDELYGKVTAAGYASRQPPYDAFSGARYAIVADPEGNDVGLMSPIDAERKYTPEVPPG